jgi:hypothetical protein
VAKDKCSSVHFDRVKRQFVNLKEDDLVLLRESYVGVDIDAELKKMSLWLLSPKGKLRKGEMSFIMNWLSNAPVTKKQQDVPTSDDTAGTLSLRPYLDDYLKELWNGREHILQLNTRKN